MTARAEVCEAASGTQLMSSLVHPINLARELGKDDSAQQQPLVEASSSTAIGADSAGVQVGLIGTSEPSAKGNASDATQQIETIIQAVKKGELSLGQAAHEVRLTLHKNTSLTELDLDDNDVGDEGARVLAEALRSNKSLTNLELCSNNVGYEGARALADALRTNTSLTEIRLASNNVGDEGAGVLADALRTNTSLTEFALAINQIGDAGAAALAQALQQNSSLTYLWLSSPVN